MLRNDNGVGLDHRHMCQTADARITWAILLNVGTDMAGKESVFGSVLGRARIGHRI